MIKFFENSTDIIYCFVDNTQSYSSAWTKEIIKNISDYTISKLSYTGVSLVQSENENEMLRYAAECNYKHAVVFTTGTEFINGDSFFNNVNELTNTDYFIYGHILDRKDAYYELHHQSYLINIEKYKLLGMPTVGKTELGNPFITFIPVRSEENIHDDYTPLWISNSSNTQQYSHRLHGWNIISQALTHGYNINAWPETVRQNKIHYYPENSNLFNENIIKIYKKYNHCQDTFVHTSGTDELNELHGFKQIVTTASGNWWEKYATDDTEVILYDYNQASLDYWKEHTSHNNVKFIKCDILTDNLLDYVSDLPSTLINLSNIFMYEGTVALQNLETRVSREQFYMNNIQHAKLLITGNAAAGFTNKNYYNMEDLIKPTWHIGDWNEK